VLERITRSTNHGTEVLCRSLPGLLSGLLKMNAVLLFLWYLYEFATESWIIGKHINAFVILSGLLFLAFAASIFVKGFWDELKCDPRTLPRTNGSLYLVLVVAPILAVALVRLVYAGHRSFSSKLLEGTETQIERFYAAFK